MIIVGGEALVDLVPVLDSAGEPALSPRLGGGPFNVAVAASRLGTKVGFLSRISLDGFGNAAMRRLQQEGVDVGLVQRGDELTTLAIADVDSAGSVRYAFYVEGTADRMFEYPGDLPADTQAVVLGTIGMMLEPGATAYDQVLAASSAKGILTVIDPNIRDSLIPDDDSYRARFRQRLRHTNILKASIEDVAWLADSDRFDDLEALLPTLRDWREQGPDVIVVTLGAHGVFALTPAGQVNVAGVPTSVVDTIGAGDTVLGSLVAWLAVQRDATVEAVAEMTAEDWRQALSFAARAASITCSRSGANPPYAHEL